MAGGPEDASVDPEGQCSLPGPLKDGPVLTLMSKRLRALRKKYNRIIQIEENKAQGKPIIKEQEEVLKTKVAVTTLIDEYEKLRQPLGLAVKEELAEREAELVAATLGGRGAEENKAEEKEVESNAVRKDTINGFSEEVRSDIEGQTPAVTNGGSEYNMGEEQESEPVHEKREGEEDSAIGNLLKLLYFSQLFDITSQRDAPSMMWTKVHERSSCLSYDFVTEDSTNPLLEADLDTLSLFGSLLTSRPPNVILSHRDALQQCIQHADLWLQNSEEPIHPDSGITYSHLRERLQRILSSEYFTMTPELQTVSQQAAAAAATVAEQYASKVLIHDASTGIGVFEREDTSNFYPHEALALPQQQFFQGEEGFVSSAHEAPSSSSNIGLLNAHAVGIAAATNVSESTTASVVIQQLGRQDCFDDHTSASRDSTPEPEQVQQQQETAPPTQPVQQEQPQLSQGSVGPRVYQGSKGSGRGMGQGTGGRGRGYLNGRGRSGRGGGYTNGRGGQYYDQGGYYPRNYYGRGGGRGSRGGGLIYSNHVNGSAAATPTTATL